MALSDIDTVKDKNNTALTFMVFIYYEELQ